MRYALDTGVPRESRHWRLDDCVVAGLAAPVALCLRQVRSWDCLKSGGRLGPCFAFRAILEVGRDRHSSTDLRAWLQRGILVS